MIANVTPKRFAVGLIAIAVLSTTSWHSIFAQEPSWAQQLVNASMKGDQATRDRLLSAAAEKDAAPTLVNSLRGRLENAGGKWLTIEESIADPTRQKRLAEYESRRDEIDETAQDHWALSRWCNSQRLHRRAEAHAIRTIEFAPNFLPARRFLNHVQVGSVWMEADQAKEQQRELRQSQRHLETYLPKMQALANRFESAEARELAKAHEALATIDTADAVEAITSQAFRENDSFSLAAIAWLGQRQEAKAAVALARLAVYDSRRGIRERASVQLEKVDSKSFVPDMLQWCRGEVEVEHARLTNPRGALQRVISQYKREQHDGVKVLNVVTDIVAVEAATDPGASIARADAVENLQLDVVRNQLDLEADADSFNEQSRVIHRRVASVLRHVDPEYSAGESSQEMRKWWLFHNGYASSGEPGEEHRLVHRVSYRAIGNDAPIGVSPTRVSGNQLFAESGSTPDAPADEPRTWAQKRAESVPPPQLSLPGFGMRPRDCLVAGTVVWTDLGPRPIETLRVGDQVLTCDVTDGKLSYQSVLAPTTREPEPLTRIHLDNDVIVASKGHPFWVIGRGWTTVQELVPGDTLHAADGISTIQSLNPAPPAETYNLVVRGNHSYFVGKSRVLSHDAELDRDDSGPIPGLTTDSF